MDAARFNTLFSNLINLGAAVAVLFCAFFFMVGAFKYASSGADYKQQDSGKIGMRNALIGLVGILAARIIVQWFRGALGL